MKPVIAILSIRVQWHASDNSNIRGQIRYMVMLDENGMADFSSEIFAVVDSFGIKQKDATTFTPGVE